MNLTYPRLATRLFNRPLMVEPRTLDAFVDGCQHLFGLGPEPAAVPRRPDPELIRTHSARASEDRRFRIAEGGIGIVDIQGALRHRGGFDADSTHFQGYEGIARSVEAAVASDETQAVVLAIDSPGGEVAGVFDLAQRIYAARDVKPIHAVVSDLGASAAYLIAAAASEISITPTAEVGSIGVVYRHLDLSRRLQQDGVDVTFIYAGERKVWGNSAEPLSDDVKARFQRDADELYQMFVARVAEYRGLQEADVRATQADLFLGRRALDAGLADHLETPDELLDRLAKPQEDSMFTRNSKKPKEPKDPQEPAAAQSPEGRPEGTLDALTAELADQQRQAEAQLEQSRLATARLEVEQRLDALGSRVNLGMRQSGLPEALVQLMHRGVQVNLGRTDGLEDMAQGLAAAAQSAMEEQRPAVEVIFAALAAIPELAAVTQDETAGADADGGARPAGDVRTDAERTACTNHGIDDDEARRLQAKYPESFRDVN